jgi:hypothetical protein
MLHYSSLKILIFQCVRWKTIRTAPLRTAIYAQGASTVTASLCCYGMPLSRLAMGTEPQSTTIGSMRSTGYNIARYTSISRPTPCFLIGAHGPHGLLVLTWMIIWRRLLTWHSLPCACKTYLLLQARHLTVPYLGPI